MVLRHPSSGQTCPSSSEAGEALFSEYKQQPVYGGQRWSLAFVCHMLTGCKHTAAMHIATPCATVEGMSITANGPDESERFRGSTVVGWQFVPRTEQVVDAGDGSLRRRPQLAASPFRVRDALTPDAVPNPYPYP